MDRSPKPEETGGKRRVVGSMTTIPQRVKYIQPILVKLLKQPLDLIYLNIPYRSRRNVNYRLPRTLQRFINKHPRIKLVRCKDYGPITKLIPTLEHEHDGETAIITFDDDIYPLEGMVENLVKTSRIHPNKALGYSGVCWGKFPGYYQLTGQWTQEVEVDWIEGVYSAYYLRKFFNPDELLDFPRKMGLSKELLTNDDHWISGYLASQQIQRISLGYDVRDYFKYTPARWVNPLSGRGVQLIREHGAIIARFNIKGWYGRSYNKLRSHGLYITLLILLVVLVALLITLGYY